MVRQLSQNSTQSDNHHSKRGFAAKLCGPNPVCPSASENSKQLLLAEARLFPSRSETKYDLEDGESEEQSQDLAGSSHHGNEERTFVFTLVPNQLPRQGGLWVISGLQP